MSETSILSVPPEHPGLAVAPRSLIDQEAFRRLAEVPPEVEWFANLSSAATRRAYETALQDFRRFVGLREVSDFRRVTRAHVIAWRDDLVARTLSGSTVRHRLAALSSLFEYLCEKNAVTHNPVKGVRKNKEKPRDFYADDAVWSAVYAAACIELQDAMDLNYLTGQRPADVLKMRLADIKDGVIEVQQNKTKKKLRILLDDEGVRTELGKVIDRIKARERKVASLFLIATPAGTALNQWTLRTRFDDARAAAAKAAAAAGDDALAARIRAFQFRDIRPKAASEMDLEHASKLLGHTEHEITEKVYRRVGETVKPTK